MKTLRKSHKLFHASQNEVAQFMDVDRGTIRNWANGGMPYTDNGSGKPAEYDASIVFYWWASHIHRNHYKLPETTPCRRLAVARAFVDRCDDAREQRLSREEFPDCFRLMVGKIYPKAEIEQAIAYAEAVFDMTFNKNKRG
jgi:hypothetical protein